jgi:hypothetical protein
MKLRRRRWGIIVTAAALVLVLAFAAYHLFLPDPRAMAYLTMQVNPALQLSLDREHKVIGVKGVDEGGKALVAQLGIIKNMELPQALREITDVLMDGGFLRPEVRIVVVLHPIDEREEENLPGLSAIAHQAVTARLVEIGVQIKVISQVISEDLYDTAFDEGLLPADFVDLIEAGVSENTIKSIIGLGKELGIEQELFLEEFDTIASAVEDMDEAGITANATTELIREAMRVDPSLEEVATITAAMIDLHEAGATQENIMAVFRLVEGQIAANITTRALLLEEFTTITAAKIDMIEAGITTAANASAILEGAMRVDPSLEEVATITAAMIDLHEAGATQENIMAVFRLVEGQIAANITTRALLLEEFTTITAAKVDLLDAGVTAEIALAVLRTALAADPKLEELTIITAAMIVLIEEGLSEEEALARIQAAIEADPTLQKFEEEVNELEEAAEEPQADLDEEAPVKPEDESQVQETVVTPTNIATQTQP